MDFGIDYDEKSLVSGGIFKNEHHTHIHTKQTSPLYTNPRLYKSPPLPPSSLFIPLLFAFLSVAANVLRDFIIQITRRLI